MPGTVIGGTNPERARNHKKAVLPRYTEEGAGRLLNRRLRELLDERGVEHKSGDTKSDLVARLLAWQDS